MDSRNLFLISLEIFNFKKTGLPERILNKKSFQDFCVSKIVGLLKSQQIPVDEKDIKRFKNMQIYHLSMRNKRTMGTVSLVLFIGALYLFNSGSQGNAITGYSVAPINVGSISILALVLAIAISAMFIGKFDWISR